MKSHFEAVRRVLKSTFCIILSQSHYKDFVIWNIYRSSSGILLILCMLRATMKTRNWAQETFWLDVA